MSEGQAAPAGQAAPIAPEGAQSAAAVVAPVVETVAPPIDTSDKWYSSVAEESHGYIENKGWNGPEDMLKSYMGLEKMRGVPEDQLIKMPAAEDAEGMSELFNRLGRPETADGYELGLEEGDYSNWYRDTVHGLGLNNEQAKGLQTAHDAFMETQKTGSEEQFLLKAGEEMKSLRNEWGAAYDNKLQQVKAGADKLGWDQAQVELLERSHGTKFMMETMARIGESIGEADFQGGGSTNQPAANGMMTREAAKARYTEMRSDESFQKRLYSDDKKISNAAVEERSRISRMAFDE
jgi:hypothetical protein